MLVIVISSGGNDVPENAVASIDGKPITKEDFDHWLEGIAASQQDPSSKSKPEPPKPGSEQYKALKDQVLQFLISTRWIELEGNDRGVKVGDSEVERQFKQTKDQSFSSEK
ncbi:hypothetical protein LCGC14_3057270, partial [marine sediment metagenome]